MNWVVTKKVVLGNVRGTNDNKTKYYVTNGDKQYIVLHWPGIPCVVYDSVFDVDFDSYKWYENQNGYIVTHNKDKKIVYMHSLILNKVEGKSIDHINYIKSFNVSENLRYATQSEQNTNRKDRKDKCGPPKELLDIGITNLPRYIRYDYSEGKFVIERMHPGIAISGTFNYSGSKSKNVSMIYKYYDIIKKLEYLNGLVESPERKTFLELQKSLFMEYSDISFLITGIRIPEINYRTECNSKSLEKYLTEDELEYSRRGLPKDFEGVLPEYCCYVKENGYRGDSFYISHHHPHLKEIKRTDLKTTASKKVTTQEKYNNLLTLIEIVNNYTGESLIKILKAS